MVLRPEGTREFSPGFEPWEPSSKAIRPEGAREHYLVGAFSWIVRLAPPGMSKRQHVECFQGRFIMGTVPGVETPGLSPRAPSGHSLGVWRWSAWVLGCMSA
jgi:hypothetical protein